MTVTRLLRPASTGPQAADLQEADAIGVEKPLAVMFLDLREFTQLSQSRLPYDVVYILNEFFAATGRRSTRTAAGSTSSWATACWPSSGSSRASRSAAGRRCGPHAPSIWPSITSTPSSGAEVGDRCGRHGHSRRPLLLGRIGYGEAVDLTVVGNAVNVASRLESAVQGEGPADRACRARWPAMPAASTMRAGDDVNVRGVDEPMSVIGVTRGRDLPASILSSSEEDEKTSPRVGGSKNAHTAS